MDDDSIIIINIINTLLALESFICIVLIIPITPKIAPLSIAAVLKVM